MVFLIADMNFGLGDINRCGLCAPLAPVKVGGGKARPVKYIYIYIYIYIYNVYVCALVQIDKLNYSDLIEGQE